jgi:hypothetical protein
MTDWLPWGFVFMAGTFATIGLALRSLARTPAGGSVDLRAAWWALALTVVASFGVWFLYVFWGEGWVWYLR